MYSTGQFWRLLVDLYDDVLVYMCSTGEPVLEVIGGLTPVCLYVKCGGVLRDHFTILLCDDVIARVIVTEILNHSRGGGFP